MSVPEGVSSACHTCGYATALPVPGVSSCTALPPASGVLFSPQQQSLAGGPLSRRRLLSSGEAELPPRWPRALRVPPSPLEQETEGEGSREVALRQHLFCPREDRAASAMLGGAQATS